MRTAVSVKPDKVRGEMNKTEAAYAERLDLLKRAGEIQWWSYETVRLKIAPGGGKPLPKGCYYTPDFLVITSDGEVQFHETKGFMREAARIRLLAAADQNPWARFLLVRKAKGGEWEISEVG